MKQAYGSKIGMTELFAKEEKLTVTKIKLFPLTVTQQKSDENDGYISTQVAFGGETTRASRAQKGHFKKQKPLKYSREIKPMTEKKVGDLIAPSELIEPGDIVSVQGKSKGKGFSGTIKRWNFSRQPRTHGQSDRTRAPGSIGQGTDPGRVHKGKKMAGRHGGFTTTVRSSQVIKFDESENIIYLTGSVPGVIGGIVRLTVTGHTDIPRVEDNSTDVTPDEKSAPATEENTDTESPPETIESDSTEPEIKEEVDNQASPTEQEASAGEMKEESK